METKITIVYANRNRDLKRISRSLDSLKNQANLNFEVVFVDYGSEEKLASEIKNCCNLYTFVTYYGLSVNGLLWNKSKALNYGIFKAAGEFIFVADVDLFFHPEAVQHLIQIATKESFFLFPLGYLEKKEINASNLLELIPKTFGNVNGMILVSKNSLLTIHGFDEFFHFYGSEDEDLFQRLEHLGLTRLYSDNKLFYHQWHQSFSASDDISLTQNPRLNNAMRLNQQHYNFNNSQKIIKPKGQKKCGEGLEILDQKVLQTPDLNYKIPNIKAHVVHFLNEELKIDSEKVVSVVFYCDSYYDSLKYKAKEFLGKQTQPYLSLKEVNDLVLEKIVFDYRDHNYHYSISGDLKEIKFVIKL